VFYMISPPSETDWQFPRENLIQLLSAEWPNTEITGPEEGVRAADVVWRHDALEGALVGAQDVPGQAISLSGPLILVARFAAWWRTKVAASQELIFYDEGFTTVISLKSGLSESDLLSALSDE
jgi:hypothetical protein